MQTLRFLLAGSAILAASADAQIFAADVTGAYINIPGARISCTDTGGSGTAVVFMHAGTGSSLVWEHQRSAFMGAGYRFIAYDRVGHGRSEVYPPGSHIGAAADDLEALMQSLQTIKVPTLLVTGDADLSTPPAVLRLFSARIKTSSSVILPEAGHSAYREQPALFNRAVLDFVGQH